MNRSTMIILLPSSSSYNFSSSSSPGNLLEIPKCCPSSKFLHWLFYSSHFTTTHQEIILILVSIHRTMLAELLGGPILASSFLILSQPSKSLNSSFNDASSWPKSSIDEDSAAPARYDNMKDGLGGDIVCSVTLKPRSLILFITYGLIASILLTSLMTGRFSPQPSLPSNQAENICSDPSDPSCPNHKGFASEIEPNRDFTHYGRYKLNDPGVQNLFEPEQYKNTTIVAVVFYGRRDRVQVLEMYLRRNLRKYGGILDYVWWGSNVREKEDEAWLDSVVLPSQPDAYVKVPLNGWVYTWVKPGYMFFKIDDDVVFIEDGTFENMLAAYHHLPNPFMISANIINHPRLSHTHLMLGALQAYNISLEPSPSDNTAYIYNSTRLEGSGLDRFRDGDLAHRPSWDASGECSWRSWRCAALQHENFFYNIQHNQLGAYRFRHLDFYGYEYGVRWSINMMLFNGTFFNLPDGQGSDEHYFTTVYPQTIQRHSYAIGHGIAVHYAFNAQTMMPLTRILSRYLELALNYTSSEALPIPTSAPSSKPS